MWSILFVDFEIGGRLWRACFHFKIVKTISNDILCLEPINKQLISIEDVEICDRGWQSKQAISVNGVWSKFFC